MKRVRACRRIIARLRSGIASPANKAMHWRRPVSASCMKWARAVRRISLRRRSGFASLRNRAVSLRRIASAACTFPAEAWPKDYVVAYMWFSLSAAQGDHDSAIQRDLVAKLMTPAQIAEAQKLAREWKPKP